MAIELVVGIAVASLLLGLVLGYFLPLGNAKKARVTELETALETAQEELSDYKSDVFGQFADTAQKFRALDKSYNDLHRQLAQSSVALCGDAATPLLANEASEVNDSDNPAEEPSVTESDASSDGDAQFAEADRPDDSIDADEPDPLSDDILVAESALDDGVIESTVDADTHAGVAEEVPTLTQVDNDDLGEKVEGEKASVEQNDTDDQLRKTV